MDKVARGELLKARFRAVGGLPYMPTGKPRRQRYTPTGRELNMAWGVGPPRRDDRAPDWISEADSRPPTLTTKRNQGPSALTKIAQKWRKVS